jgi:hypothetical protein
MMRRRQQRVRVLQALQARVGQFRIREELWPLRVPIEPVPLGDVIHEALGDEGGRFDPMSLRARTLLSLEWDDGSRWDAWVVVLPDGLKLYCDTGDDESRVLASGGRNVGEESDRAFIQLLAESAGSHFGIEMGGGPPSRVRSSIEDRPFLVEQFVNLFEVTGMEGSIREDLRRRGGSVPARHGGQDFQHDVELWLSGVLR